MPQSYSRKHFIKNFAWCNCVLQVQKPSSCNTGRCIGCVVLTSRLEITKQKCQYKILLNSKFSSQNPIEKFSLVHKYSHKKWVYYEIVLKKFRNLWVWWTTYHNSMLVIFLYPSLLLPPFKVQFNGLTINYSSAFMSLPYFH